MNLVFSTDNFERHKRYNAWREALCDIYLKVDSASDTREDYQGFIKEARFGAVTITETLLSPQTIRRRREHIAHLEKDCYYLTLPQVGSQRVVQFDRSAVIGGNTGAIFCTAEPYLLETRGAFRALYVEFPRSAISARSLSGEAPPCATLNTSYGMGRLVAELCALMVVESDTLQGGVSERLGNEALDLVALALETKAEDVPLADASVRASRLRIVMSYIDSHIGDPLLNPERIAKANQISVRALHYLFKDVGKSVMDWIWDRRLERCHAELQLASRQPRSITEIALSSGFNGVSHFCDLFRRKYGVTSSDVRASQRTSPSQHSNEAPASAPPVAGRSRRRHRRIR